MVTGAFADDASPNPSVLEQISMSEKLLALGKERNDAVLILAAIRLRSNLQEAQLPAPANELTSREDAFAAAMEASTGDPALNELVKDIEASQSRRMPICTNYTYGRNYCY
jgi:hypothetical protein